MPPPSTPFEDAAGEQRPPQGMPVDRNVAVEQTAPDDVGPNYLVRRAIFVGIVVVVIAVAGIVIGRMLGGSDDDATSGAASVEWNRVVLVDQRTGKITVTDSSGDETGNIDTGVRNPTASAVVGPTALITGEDATAVVDLDSEKVQSIDDLEASGVVTPAGSTRTVIATATAGQRGLLVHGPTGDLIDTDTFALVAGASYDFAESRTDASGRSVLVTDAGNFQSVLFSFDREEPAFFPGLALAINDTTVVTAQNVGSDATVSVFDHNGEPISSGRTPSVRAAMIVGARIHLVTVDGQLVVMDAISGDTEPGQQLDIGTILSGVVMTSGDRLVVTGVDGTAIIDDRGSVAAVAVDARPGEDDEAFRGSTCISLVAAAPTGEGELTVLDTRDGQTLAETELSGDLIERSADGCTVAIGLDTGYEVIDADGVRSVSDDVLISLAPDGLATIVERDRRLVLTSVEGSTDTDSGSDADIDAVELAPQGRTVWFTDL